MNENLKWNIIQKYFEDNPKCLVKHHIDSFNDFFNYNIKQIFKEKNPIKILKQQDKKTKKFHKQAHLYLAGKNGEKLYYGKPSSTILFLKIFLTLSVIKLLKFVS